MALTIRACSLLTLRSQWVQSIWSHDAAWPEDAHAVLSAFICRFLPHRFCEFSRHERPAGSLPVCTAGQCCSPYPFHYGTAFAFSSILCPPSRQRSLRTRLPPLEGGMSGLQC